MKRMIARNGKQLMSKALFWARRTFVEKNLDPSQNSILISWATYSPWLKDAEFQKTHAAIRNHTLVDIYRCYELWHLLNQTQHLSGDILEVGTWRGGTGCLMGRRAALMTIDAKVYLCDTFAGVVKTGSSDANYSGGEHADTSLETVKELAASLNLENIRILQGIFPEDTSAEIADRQFRLCHIDVDVYQSGKDILEWVWSRMPVGGVVVFDDFGFPSTTGITKLVHEYESLPDRVCVQNLNGHAVYVKTA
ncbi:MAG: O-methyltransferase [Candidatus Krumholzibacteriia bacterium]|jgi:O-methyltransferase